MTFKRNIYDVTYDFLNLVFKFSFIDLAINYSDQKSFW